MQADAAQPIRRGLLEMIGVRSASSENRGDRTFRLITTALALGLVVLLIVLVLGLLQTAWLSITHFGPAFIWGMRWNPVEDEFGALPAIYGTLATSALALLIALPVGLGSAIFLAELAPGWISKPLSFLIELLAAIPSVVIGLWGLFILVPWLRGAEQGLVRIIGRDVPLFSGPPIGIGLLAAGLLLAIMVLPILTAIIRDVLRAVPNSQREAMLALGATRWEVMTRAVVPYGRTGIGGGVVLDLGGGRGETMAVTMVAGNRYDIVPSLFAPVTSIASLLAGQFSEADSPLYVSALIEMGLVLLVITVIVNVCARLLVWKVSGGGKVGVTGGG